MASKPWETLPNMYDVNNAAWSWARAACKERPTALQTQEPLEVWPSNLKSLCGVGCRVQEDVLRAPFVCLHGLDHPLVSPLCVKYWLPRRSLVLLVLLKVPGRKEAAEPRCLICLSLCGLLASHSHFLFPLSLSFIPSRLEETLTAGRQWHRQRAPGGRTIYPWVGGGGGSRGKARLRWGGRWGGSPAPAGWAQSF